MRVGIYARVSTDEQKTNEDQLNELKKYCELYNHEVVAEYKDKESGLTTDRKDFQRMLNDVEKSTYNIEGVLVWRFDRLSRSLMDLNTTVLFLREHNVQLLSMHEHLDTSKPEGKLLFNLLGSIAEFEIDTIKVRTELGVKRAKREGKLCHRPKLRIDVEEVKKLINDGYALKKIAKMQGMSYVTLKKRLDDAGVILERGSRIKK